MKMKFLLELMSCCCCINPHGNSGKEKKSLLGDHNQAPPPESHGYRGRKRRRNFPRARIVGCRGRGNGGSAAAEWRPSLSAISEDHVFPVRNDHEEEGKVISRSSKASASDRNLRRKIHSPSSNYPPVSYEEIIGRNAQHMTMPMFSPSPFMF